MAVSQQVIREGHVPARLDALPDAEGVNTEGLRCVRVFGKLNRYPRPEASKTSPTSGPIPWAVVTMFETSDKAILS